jgi:hypothetical protein
MTEDKFSLDADPRNNYVNLILNEMKDFNHQAKTQWDIAVAVHTLRSLLLNLPPSGQECLKEEIAKTINYEYNVGLIPNYDVALKIYQKAMAWIWPNILQEYFNAKPRNPQPTTLGET